MKQIYLIARREWTSILFSPTGLAVMAVYLILSGYIFATNVSMTQEATLRYTFSTLGMLTIFIIPLLTMRLLSEELRSGTFEVLISNPVTDTQVILGKFLAGWVSFLAISFPTLSYLVILWILGNPDFGPAICGYIGQLLLSGMLVSLGLMLSASTQNQVLAAMGAMVAGLLFELARSAGYVFGGRLGNALAYLAILDHFSLFGRGILDTRAITFFLLTTIMFLFIAIRVIESRRWKFGVTPGNVPTNWDSPKLAIGLMILALLFFGEATLTWISWGLWTYYNTMVLLLGMVSLGIPVWKNISRIKYELGRRQTGLALTVLLNCALVLLIWGLAVHLTSRFYLRADTTYARHFTLSRQTETVLSKLTSPVQIIDAIVQPADLAREVRDILDEYKNRTQFLTAQNLDPLRNPAEAKGFQDRYKLNSPVSDELLIISGDRCRRVPKNALFYQVAQMVNGRRIPIPGQYQIVGEAEITSSIIQLTHSSPGAVVFLSGHGERKLDDSGNEGITRAVSELKRGGWEIRQQVITPGELSKFPPEVHLAVIAGPRKRLSDEDLKALIDLLDHNGGALALLDPGTETGMDPLLTSWNIHLGNDMVIDIDNSLSGGDPTSMFVNRFIQEHPIGHGMGSLSAVLPMSRRVAIMINNANPSVSTVNFMHTSGNSWAIEYQTGRELKLDRKRDHQGPISLGVTAQRYQEFSEPGRNPLQGRMVVIGNSNFISNQNIDMAGNLDLFLNSIDWLADRKDLISMRPKYSDTRFMPISSQQIKWVYWWSILLIPGIALSASILAVIRRRATA